MLVASVAAALLASVSLAPVAAAQASSTARTWTVQPSPNTSGAAFNVLGAVSCSGTGNCVAVGSSSFVKDNEITSQRLLVEQLSDGKWAIAKTPTISGATSSILSGVSCPVAAFCVAVGSVALPDGSVALLAETWNGSSWSASLLPNPAGGNLPSLAGVSCAAKGSCVAVGTYNKIKASTDWPLAERLTGSTWSVIPTTFPPHGGGAGSMGAGYNGVDCLTTTRCEVVGDVAYNDTLQSVFGYALSGSTWTHQDQVNPGQGTPDNDDAAVSCSSAGACTSVGSDQMIGSLALAERWDGSTWVRQATPAQSYRPNDALYGVSCHGGSACVAVGEAWHVDPNDGQLVDPRVEGEVWNGKTWTQSPPAVVSGGIAGLNAIACPSPTACIAVGGTSRGTPFATSESTLVEAYTA
jgi:hypothetical protein